MNYFERLIARALAVPRAATALLFDPFDQVAEWAADEGTSRTEHEASSIAPAVRLSAPCPTSPAVERHTARRENDDNAKAIKSKVPPTAPSPDSLAAGSNDEPPSVIEALARADRFMRSIAAGDVKPTGEAGAEPPPPDRAGPPIRTAKPATRPPAPPSSLPSAQADPASDEPVARPSPGIEGKRPGPTVRPSTRTTLPKAAVSQSPGPSRSASDVRGNSGKPPAATAASAATTKLERATLTRSGPSAERAHSLNIMRFGIGQG